jgi:hypothetical protein
MREIERELVREGYKVLTDKFNPVCSTEVKQQQSKSIAGRRVLLLKPQLFTLQQRQLLVHLVIH